MKTRLLGAGIVRGELGGPWRETHEHALGLVALAHAAADRDGDGDRRGESNAGTSTCADPNTQQSDKHQREGNVQAKGPCHESVCIRCSQPSM